MMNAMCVRSHLCKYSVSTLPLILCVYFVAKITNGVQLLLQVKAMFASLRCPECAMTLLLGSVLEF